MVRKSSQAGAFALSLRVPPPAPKVAHYLILRTSRGYKIKVSILIIDLKKIIDLKEIIELFNIRGKNGIY